ncbi:MAG: hypothetical protein ACHQ2F_13020 [Desulfobaccales bacterium]
MKDYKEFPKGTDPEEIIDWFGGGLAIDQINAIKDRSMKENIAGRRNLILSTTKESVNVVTFQRREIGMINIGDDSSISGVWDEHDKTLEINYDTGKVEIIDILEGKITVIQTVELED